VEVVRSLKALEAIAPAWQKLDEETSPRLPFTGPLWNLTWWKHFARSRSTVVDRLHSFVLFDGSELLAVAPMMLSERPSIGPLRIRHLQFFGADPNVTEIRGPCCRREDEGRMFDALLSYLEAHTNEWDWVGLSGLEEQGPAYQAMKQYKGLRRSRQVPYFFIQPGSDWEAYKAGLPRNFKEALRKCYATLRRDDLHHELKVAERPDDVKERVQTFFELHNRRAQATIATKHPDVFAAERSRSFLREYLARASEEGLAKVFELLVDGEVVASRIGFVLDDSLYLYFSGYLPKMSRYSVMTTCTVEAIKWAIARGFQTINLSTGRDQSKLRWRPTEVSLIEAQVVSPSWRGAVFHEFNYAVKQRVPEVAALPGGLGSFVKLIKRRQ